MDLNSALIGIKINFLVNKPTMKEYSSEEGDEFDRRSLESPWMKPEEYEAAHLGLPILCHDILIMYNGGLLFVHRNVFPFKDILWPIGGRVLRGVGMVDSLRKKVKEECGLELKNITELDLCRVFAKTDPFGHGKGTDTPAMRYFGEGFGELKLNDLHQKPVIVRPEDLSIEFKERLHPYVRDFVNLCVPLIGK